MHRDLVGISSCFQINDNEIAYGVILMREYKNKKKKNAKKTFVTSSYSMFHWSNDWSRRKIAEREKKSGRWTTWLCSARELHQHLCIFPVIRFTLVAHVCAMCRRLFCETSRCKKHDEREQQVEKIKSMCEWGQRTQKWATRNKIELLRHDGCFRCNRNLWYITMERMKYYRRYLLCYRPMASISLYSHTQQMHADFFLFMKIWKSANRIVRTLWLHKRCEMKMAFITRWWSHSKWS